MTPSVFHALRSLAYDNAGIALRDSKEALVSARVQKRLLALGLKDERAYLAYLRADSSGDELVHFLDAISTNFTSFFREPEHFRFLVQEAEGWRRERRAKVRVWCAASATGEEPYTLAMTLAETLGGDTDFKILATDISTRALEAAKAGRYPESRLSDVPRTLRDKYFVREAGSKSEDPFWQAGPQLRSHLMFKRLNLSVPPFPMRGNIDAVFCRNVMIYFDQTVRKRLVTEIERLLRPNGLFIIAHSETLGGIQAGFRVLKPSIYRKGGHGQAISHGDDDEGA